MFQTCQAVELCCAEFLDLRVYFCFSIDKSFGRSIAGKVDIRVVEFLSAERTFKDLLIFIEIQDSAAIGTCIALKRCHYSAFFFQQLLVKPL